MRRTILALLLSAGLVAACGKQEPTPPAAPVEATPQPADPAKDKAALAEHGDEANQPRRAIEDGTKQADPGTVAEPIVGGTPPARVEEPKHGGGAAGDARTLEAAAQLTPGPEVDLGQGAAAAEALAYLPGNTAGLFVVASPRNLLDAFGYDQLKTMPGSRMAEASQELIKETGHDLLDPAVWAELGIDLAGPAGGAAIGSEQEPYIIFLTIGDRAKLDAALTAAATKGGKTFDREKIGDAELLSVADYDRNVIVLRGKSAMIVGVDRADGARALGRKVAAQDKATSLLQAVEFTAAVKPLENREDVLVWGNLGLGVRLSVAMQGDRGGRRAEAQMKMVDELFRGMSGFAMGGSVRERALEVSAFLPLASDAMVRRLVKNFEGMPAAFTATSEVPILAMAARIDPKVMLELVELSLAAEGESLAEVRAAAKEMGGVDLDQDVFGVFDGQGSFVVTGDLSALTRGDRFDPKSLGGALVIGLANPEALKKLFVIASKFQDELPPGFRLDPSGTMDLPLPTGHVVHVQIAGNALVMATDAKVAERIAAGDASASFVAKLDHPGLKALVSRPNQAAWFLMPQRLMGMWLLARSDKVPAMSDAVADDGAKSPERVAKEKQLATLRAQLEAAEQTREAAQMKAADELFAKLGTFAETVEVTEGGLQIRAGQYLGGTPAELVQAIMQAMQAKHTSDRGDDDLYKQVFDLENEVRALELKDDMANEPK